MDIEEQVHRRLMELEAYVLQEAASASERQAWGLSSDTPAPLCPTCAVPLQARGQRERTLHGNGGQSVTLKRTYGICPRCRAGLFPLDEELALLPGQLAPRQQEHLTHLACFMPFEQAAQMLETLLGVHTTGETARSLTERMGACMEAAHVAETETPSVPVTTDLPVLSTC